MKKARHVADGKRERAHDKESIKEAEVWERVIDTQKREKERADQSCFSHFLQLLIRSSGRLCDAAASSPVVAFWLWCRSGRFTVPPGLHTCQPASLHNQAMQRRERERQRERDRERERERHRERERCFSSCSI